jgi:hypothetical protein
MKTSVPKAFCRVLPLHVRLQKPHKRREDLLISVNKAMNADGLYLAVFYSLAQ